MSANLVVDLGATCDYKSSVNVGSGSNFTVGQVCDLLGANTYCNVSVNGLLFGSGLIEVRVQTSDSTASGTFTDPTSGLAALPSFLASGGVMFANSGLFVSGYSSLSAPVNNAPLFCSGGVQYGAFQRPHRYARLLLNSGAYPNPIQAGFISNKKTIGSGAGFTYAPGSGSVDV